MVTSKDYDQTAQADMSVSGAHIRFFRFCRAPTKLLSIRFTSLTCQSIAGQGDEAKT